MKKERLKKILSSMEIEIWHSRNAYKSMLEAKFTDAADQKESQKKKNISCAGWETLQNSVLACKACPLHKTRIQAVFGTGSKNANLLLIGEAPGANEDKQGEPFVGRAGMLLTAMLKSIGLDRCEVYIANILKCRPPQNRDPLPEEVKLCTPFLLEQIELVNPKLIVAVGRIAAAFLLDTTEAMARLRGRQYQYGAKKIPLLVTYHPAYLLRSPKEKSKAYTDFLLIKKLTSTEEL